MLLTTIFYNSDDFCKEYEKLINPKLLRENTSAKGGRPRRLTLSEVITICIYFQCSGYRNFKQYYTKCVLVELKNAFGKLVSYNRFTELMHEAAEPLGLFAVMRCSKSKLGLSFIDSTKLVVCNNLRIYSHKVFKGVAARGKTSTGWFYGFKLHIVINHVGEIVSFFITPGNVNDRNKNVIDRLTKNLKGLLCGDKGYLSKVLFNPRSGNLGGACSRAG